MAVGEPTTANEKGLPNIGLLVSAKLSVIFIVNSVVAGDVKENVNFVPPPTRVSIVLPEAPDVYVGCTKSLLSPGAAPTVSNTVTVHEIASLTRTYVVDA